MDQPRYNALGPHLKARFGGRVAKIALDAGLSCPNRDGTISRRGCIFCDGRGSGTGAAGQGRGVKEQVEAAIPYLVKRYKTSRFIAYFQSFSNTYGSVERLAKLYSQALAFDQVLVLAIGTRPDCLEPAKLDLLARINQDKEVWLELGLQSAHDETLEAINRGHDFACFREATEAAAAKGIKVWVHLILGLPGETYDHAAETIHRLAPLPLAGVKLHGLYVSADAPLAQDYQAGRVELFSLEEYSDQVARLIGLMPGHWIIQRLTSDPDPKKLLAPDWMLDKPKVLKAIQRRMEEMGVFQG